MAEEAADAGVQVPAYPAYVVADLQAETLPVASRTPGVAVAANIRENQGSAERHPNPTSVERVAPAAFGAVAVPEAT